MPSLWHQQLRPVLHEEHPEVISHSGDLGWGRPQATRPVGLRNKRRFFSQPRGPHHGAQDTDGLWERKKPPAKCISGETARLAEHWVHKQFSVLAPQGNPRGP